MLVRQMTFSEAKKMPIKEFSLERMLKDMEMSHEQFVDFCILLGCDYCGNIKGIGPKKAFDLIKQHKNIETILENIDLKKYPPPEDWKYKEARELFLNPDVLDGSEIELNWTEPKISEIVYFMCNKKGFNEDRIRSAVERLQKSRKSSQQGRIDMFFKSTGVMSSTEPTAKKRKLEEVKKPAVKKDGKKKGKVGK